MNLLKLIKNKGILLIFSAACLIWGCSDGDKNTRGEQGSIEDFINSTFEPETKEFRVAIKMAEINRRQIEGGLNDSEFRQLYDEGVAAYYCLSTLTKDYKLFNDALLDQQLDSDESRDGYRNFENRLVTMGAFRAPKRADMIAFCEQL